MGGRRCGGGGGSWVAAVVPRTSHQMETPPFRPTPLEGAGSLRAIFAGYWPVGHLRPDACLVAAEHGGCWLGRIASVVIAAAHRRSRAVASSSHRVRCQIYAALSADTRGRAMTPPPATAHPGFLPPALSVLGSFGAVSVVERRLAAVTLAKSRQFAVSLVRPSSVEVCWDCAAQSHWETGRYAHADGPRLLRRAL